VVGTRQEGCAGIRRCKGVQPSYSTVDIPASSTANNVIRARCTRIMFPTIAFPSHESLSGQIAQAQRPGDQHRRALSCRSCGVRGVAVFHHCDGLPWSGWTAGIVLDGRIVLPGRDFCLWKRPIEIVRHVHAR
jgi:hypothetical protein